MADSIRPRLRFVWSSKAFSNFENRVSVFQMSASCLFAKILCGMNHMIRWLFLLLGDFESGLERLFIFPSALLFVLLHFLFCAEDAVYIGTHGLEFFVIILEIMV